LPYSRQHCVCNSANFDAVNITSLTVGITVPATALCPMQYRLPALQLASPTTTALALNAILVTCHTVATIWFATALVLMQYSLLLYSWHHCNYNRTSSKYNTSYLSYICNYLDCNSTSSDTVYFTTLELVSL
jgi:hypothetical protein